MKEQEPFKEYTVEETKVMEHYHWLKDVANAMIFARDDENKEIFEVTSDEQFLEVYKKKGVVDLARTREDGTVAFYYDSVIGFSDWYERD